MFLVQRVLGRFLPHLGQHLLVLGQPQTRKVGLKGRHNPLFESLVRLSNTLAESNEARGTLTALARRSGCLSSPAEEPPPPPPPEASPRVSSTEMASSIVLAKCVSSCSNALSAADASTCPTAQHTVNPSKASPLPALCGAQQLCHFRAL